jgi:hypothetical protein
MGDNIRVDLREVGPKDAEWIHLAQESDHGNEPSGSIKGGELTERLSAYREKFFFMDLVKIHVSQYNTAYTYFSIAHSFARFAQPTELIISVRASLPNKPRNFKQVTLNHERPG